MSRVNSARIAAIKASGRVGLVVKGRVSWQSDAFFPFRDGIDDRRGRRHRRVAIVQPGGSRFATMR